MRWSSGSRTWQSPGRGKADGAVRPAEPDPGSLPVRSRARLHPRVSAWVRHTTRQIPGVETEAVAEGLERFRARTRSSARQLLWWVWPSYPTSWSAVPERVGPVAVQITRLTIAAVVAYLVADAVSPGILDLTAPLTALLVVQASTVGTLQMGLVRVGAVLTGVLVAVGFASSFRLS